MNKSVIIQKLIQTGQMLERGELEYSGAEADTEYYLEQYAALYITDVSSMYCNCQQSQCYLINGSYICATCNKPFSK